VIQLPEPDPLATGATDGPTAPRTRAGGAAGAGGGTTDGWQRRRERISLQIERTALELFARYSPEDVTIDQIASEAGISNRTFFRYFASRDEVLAALPHRSLERISELVRSRPPSESVLQAFTEAEQAVHLDPSERELVLLWGIVFDRAPVAATLALTHSAFSKAEVYERLIAERTRTDPDDPAVGAMASAIAGVISYAFRRWVRLGGRAALGQMIAESLTVLKDIDKPPGGGLSTVSVVDVGAATRSASSVVRGAGRRG
jgi:TetR/AcrR family transcriptional regulator, regulator of mycofactocin system